MAVDKRIMKEKPVINSHYINVPLCGSQGVVHESVHEKPALCNYLQLWDKILRLWGGVGWGTKKQNKKTPATKRRGFTVQQRLGASKVSVAIVRK